MDLNELLQKRANLWNEAQALRETVAARPEEQRSMTAEEQQTWDRLVREIQDLTAKIRTEEEAREIERQIGSSTPVTPGDPTTRAGAGGEDREDPTGEEAYERAFEQYLRRGQDGLQDEVRSVLTGFDPETGEEIRAQGTTSGAVGGYLVPQGFRQRLTERMKDFSGVRQVAEVITTDQGNDLPWPTNDDTGNKGAILSENTQVTEQDVVIGQKMLKAYMFTSKLIRVSIQLMQDSAFNLNAWVPKKAGERIGRIHNELFTIGTGTNEPEGIATGASVGKTGAAGQVTTFTYADLVDLIFSVDAAYRNQGGENRPRWMLRDLAIASVMKLVDGDDRPLWVPSIQAGVPDTLLGYGIVPNNDMPAPAASAKSILFGDFNSGYVIRDVTGVGLIRFVERYGDFLQVGFLAYQRSDGKVQDSNAYKAYAHPAA